MSESPRRKASGSKSPSADRKASSSPVRSRNRSAERSARSKSDSRSQRSENKDRSGSRRCSGSRRRDEAKTSTQIYVAKLHKRTREEDLREAFSKFGKIKEVALKYAYAFIDFEDQQGAESAIKEMNGKTFVNGEQLVVE